MRLVRGAVVLALAITVIPVGAWAGGHAHGSPEKFSRPHGGLVLKGDPFRSWRHQLPRDHGARFHAPFVPFSPFAGFGGFGGTTVVATTAIAGGYESGYVAGPVAPPVASLVEYVTRRLPVDPARVASLVQKRKTLRMAGPDRLRMEAKMPEWQQRAAAAKELLGALTA